MKKIKVTFNAPVTLWFVILCFGALILNIVTKGWANNAFFSVYRSPLYSPLTYVRFVGYVFGHASWDHYLGNMVTLLLVGPLLEEKYGSRNLALVMLFTTVITGILSFIIFPHVQLLGASGIVFAFILLASITGVKEGEIPLTFILVAAVYLGEQVYQGVFMVDNVSNFGHVIGGVCGSIIGYLLNKGSSDGTSSGTTGKSAVSAYGGQYNDNYNTYY